MCIHYIMATAAVQQPVGDTFSRVAEPLVQENNLKKHDVATQLFYYKDPGDGSPPAPSYVGYVSAIVSNTIRTISSNVLFRKPETYDRPHVAQDVVVHDISGEEDHYTLDSHGFQIYKHESGEKDFQDDGKIKAEYYPETEQLLKDA